MCIYIYIYKHYTKKTSIHILYLIPKKKPFFSGNLHQILAGSILHRSDYHLHCRLSHSTFERPTYQKSGFFRPQRWVWNHPIFQCFIMKAKLKKKHVLIWMVILLLFLHPESMCLWGDVWLQEIQFDLVWSVIRILSYKRSGKKDQLYIGKIKKTTPGPNYMLGATC